MKLKQLISCLEVVAYSRITRQLQVQNLAPAVYKSGTGTRGQGHGDACVGTWDLGTRGRQKQGRRGRGM